MGDAESIRIRMVGKVVPGEEAVDADGRKLRCNETVDVS